MLWGKKSKKFKNTKLTQEQWNALFGEIKNEYALIAIETRIDNMESKPDRDTLYGILEKSVNRDARDVKKRRQLYLDRHHYGYLNRRKPDLTISKSEYDKESKKITQELDQMQK